jgi:predicted chitinase
VKSGGSVVEEINPNKPIKEVKGKPTKSITLEQLIAFGLNKKIATEYLEPLNQTLIDYQINTDLRIIHFLAQVIHESISFTATSEIGVTDADYDGFKGRGLMQLTTRKNYEAFEEYEGEDFTSSLKNKEKLEKIPYSIRSAGWFWTINAKLNQLADENDFIYITKMINGGYNHFDFRLKILKKGFKIFKIDYKDYKFKESEAYNDEKASFGWGLWHDPFLNKVGFIKDNEIAIEGYKRYLELAPNGKHTNWYRILTMNNFLKLKFKKDNKHYINVIDVVKQQLEILQKNRNYV